MSLKFIYGRSGSGKSYYCFQDIKRKIEENSDKKLILLVPEQFSFQSEKNLINYIGERAVSRAEVLSFKRMAYRVFNEVGGVTHRYMNESGKNMLLYSILNELTGELKIFNNAANKNGFVSTLSDIITEFKRYNLPPEMIKEYLEVAEEREDNILKGKLQDIYLIYSKFQDSIRKKFIDEEENLTILADKLKESKYFDGAYIWVDEFFNFTPQEYLVLEELLLKAEKVNITLCTGGLNEGERIDNLDLFLPVKNTEEKILEFVKRNNIKYEKPIKLNCDPCYRFKNSKELSHMEKNLFAFPYKIHEKYTEDICVFQALNEYSEIEYTARDIIKLVRDNGFRYKDIAVITGDLEGYQSLIKAVFTEYGIPYFIDKKVEVDNNPLVIFILSSLEVLNKNWNYESVFRYLKAGLVDIKREEIDIIENYVLANGIRGKRWIEEKDWDYKILYGFNLTEEKEEEEEEKLKKINEIRRKITEPLIEFHNNIKGEITPKKMCLELYNFLEKMNISSKIESWIKYFKERNRLDKINEYKQIWDVAIGLMEQLVEVMKEEKLNSRTLENIFKSGFEQYELGIIPPSLDQVLVSSTKRLRSHEIKALYIVGTNDGVFPSVLDENGILSDLERENLRETGLEVAKDTKSTAFEEQFLMYVTLTTMSDYLRISYPIANEEGKTLRPSIVISRLRKIFPNLCEKSNVIKEEDDIEKISSPKPTFNEFISQLRVKEEGLELSSIWLSVYDWFMNNKEWKEKFINISQGFNHTNYAEIVDTRRVRKLYGSKLNMSVSRLEKFSQCPFAYFIRYGMNAKERKIYKVSTPDIGTLMHDVVESFSRHIEGKNISWEEIDRELCESFVSIMVDEKIKDMKGSILNSSPRYKHMTNRIKDILSKSMEVISQQISRGDFKPSAYELAFGFNGDFPPISIELSSGEKVNLIGRIDRVDKLENEDGTFIRIIDYKSGKQDFNLSDIYYGLQIQLLVYLDALLQEIEDSAKKEVNPAGILYFNMDDPLISTKKEITKEEAEKEILKKLKLKGLVLKDANIIKAMDNLISGYSDIISVRVNKDGSPSKNSSVADLEDFQLLRKYVRKLIVELCEEMLEGNISIKPYKKNNYTPCGFCDYSSICQFDTSIKGSQYRFINDKKDDEVLQCIREEMKED